MNVKNIISKVDWVVAFLTASVVTFVVGLPIAIYLDHQADKIILNSNDWRCTKYKTTIQPMVIGKTIISTNNLMCVKWELN